MPPQEPVIGLAVGETRWRGMTPSLCQPRTLRQPLLVQPDFLEPQAVVLAVVVRGVVPDIGLPAIGARTPPKTFLFFYRAAAGQAQCCANAALPSADGSLTLPFNLAWWWPTMPANKSHGRKLS